MTLLFRLISLRNFCERKCQRRMWADVARVIRSHRQRRALLRLQSSPEELSLARVTYKNVLVIESSTYLNASEWNF